MRDPQWSKLFTFSPLSQRHGEQLICVPSFISLLHFTLKAVLDIIRRLNWKLLQTEKNSALLGKLLSAATRMFDVINELLHSAFASYSVVMLLPVLCLRWQVSWNWRLNPGEIEPTSQARVQRLFQVLPTGFGPVNTELCLDLVPVLFQTDLLHGLLVTHLVNLQHQQSNE